MATKLLILLKRDCGHEVEDRPDAAKLQEPCPLCGRLSPQVVFTVKDVVV